MWRVFLFSIVEHIVPGERNIGPTEKELRLTDRVSHSENSSGKLRMLTQSLKV